MFRPCDVFPHFLLDGFEFAGDPSVSRFQHWAAAATRQEVHDVWSEIDKRREKRGVQDNTCSFVSVKHRLPSRVDSSMLVVVFRVSLTIVPGEIMNAPAFFVWSERVSADCSKCCQ